MVCAIAGRWTGNNLEGPTGPVPQPALDGVEVISLSTKAHVSEAHRGRAQRRTCGHLRRAMVTVEAADGSGQTTMSVLQYLVDRVPSPRVSSLEAYIEYMQSLRPIRDAWLRVHRLGNVQRQRLEVIKHIDKSLDNLCRRLIGPGSENEKDKVLIAYGSGYHVCSYGFGYAPAPQQRLRHRLELVHDTRVTVIHEAYTSQKCCWCHQQLTAVHRTDAEGRRAEVHGVKRCAHCSIEGKPGVPKYWNRDVNAAWNILHIYLELGGDHGRRPDPFIRGHGDAA